MLNLYIFLHLVSWWKPVCVSAGAKAIRERERDRIKNVSLFHLFCQRKPRHSDKCLHKPKHMFSIFEEIWIDSTPKVTTERMCCHTVKAFFCYLGMEPDNTSNYNGTKCGGQYLSFEWLKATEHILVTILKRHI